MCISLLFISLCCFLYNYLSSFSYLIFFSIEYNLFNPTVLISEIPSDSPLSLGILISSFITSHFVHSFKFFWLSYYYSYLCDCWLSFIITAFPVWFVMFGVGSSLAESVLPGRASFTLDCNVTLPGVLRLFLPGTSGGQILS